MRLQEKNEKSFLKLQNLIKNRGKEVCSYKHQHDSKLLF